MNFNPLSFSYVDTSPLLDDLVEFLVSYPRAAVDYVDTLAPG